MPEPVSATSIITLSPCMEVETRISFSSASPSGMAWAALRIRFKKTCPRRGSEPTTAWMAPNSRTTRARCRMSFQAIRRVESRTRWMSTGTERSSEPREKICTSRTIRRTRSAAAMASAAASAASRMSSAEAPGCSRVSQTIERLPTTAASGLLISCATPAASIPIEAIRSLAIS